MQDPAGPFIGPDIELPGLRAARGQRVSLVSLAESQ